MAPHQMDQISNNPDPIHPSEMSSVFFENERHIGHHPISGEPIYEGSRKMAVFEDKIDPNTGEQEMRKHAVSGVPLVGVRKLAGLMDEGHIYKKISDGRGNMYREECEHPKVLQARFQKEMDDAADLERGMDLIRSLGRGGYTIEQIRAAIDGAERPSPSARQAAEQVAAEMPSRGAVPPIPRRVDPVQQQPAQISEEDLTDPGFPERLKKGWYLTVEHKDAVQRGEQKLFEGSEDEAKGARLMLLQAAADARAQLEKVPTI